VYSVHSANKANVIAILVKNVHSKAAATHHLSTLHDILQKQLSTVDQQRVFIPGIHMGVTGRMVDTDAAVVRASHAQTFLQEQLNPQSGESGSDPPPKRARAGNTLSYSQVTRGDPTDSAATTFDDDNPKILQYQNDSASKIQANFEEKLVHTREGIFQALEQQLHSPTQQLEARFGRLEQTDLGESELKMQEADETFEKY
jgi:hypothetical protein